MALHWMKSPFLDTDTIAGKLYGTTSKWHTYRLRQKIQGAIPFESWEIELLNEIKEELMSYLTPRSSGLMLQTEIHQQA